MPVVRRQQATVGKYLGVQLHMTLWKSGYTDYDKVFDLVRATGCAFVRDYLTYKDINNPNGRSLAFYRRLRDAGIKTHFTVGTMNVTTDADHPAMLAALKRVADCAHSVATWNEPDGKGDANWIAKTAAEQKWLYTAVKSHPKLAHIRVAAPGCRGDMTAQNYADLYAAINPYCDWVNLHVYPRGGAPGPYLDKQLALLPASVTGKPILISEGGYNTGTALVADRRGFPVTEQEQADYLVQFLEDVARRNNIVGVNVYELLEDPDPDLNTWEAHFGIARADFSEKPAVAALALTAATPVSAAAGRSVFIDFVRYDPAGRDTGTNAHLNKEIVVIHNKSDSVRGLTGWTLRDTSGHLYRFPATRLGPHDTVKVHTGKGNDRAGHRYWGQRGYIWNNTGDKATLRNKTGKIIDTCSWGDGDGSTDC